MALESELGGAAPSVVLLKLELGRGLLVAEDPGVVVCLKRGRGAELAHAAFDAALERVGLAFAESEHDDLLRFTDRANAHRERLGGNFGHVAAEEESGVVLDGRRGEIHDRSAARKRSARLVEGDMAV